MTHVFRAPMRSRLDEVPEFAAVRRGLAQGLCGLGGRLDPPPADLAEALARTASTYGDRAADRLRRFHDVPVGSLVWTRDEDGRFLCGALSGPWSYDASPAAYEADLVHVRACIWTPVPDADVPDAVHETFGRGGRNFQRIRRL